MGWKEDLRQRLEAVPVTGTTRQAAREDYESALQNYLDGVPKERILSVYRTGSVSAPGLSDIDLFLVLREDRRDNRWKYSIRKLAERDRYLFSHETELVSTSVFERLPLWFPAFSLEHLSGERVEVRCGNGRGRDLNLMLLVKFLTLKLPAELFLYSFLGGVFHERVCENMVHSVLHALTLWEGSGGAPVEGGGPFVQGVKELRSSWFELDPLERRRGLRDLVVEACEVIFRLQGKAASLLRERWFMGDPPSEEWEIDGPGLVLSFSRRWEEDRCLDLILSGGRPVLPLPVEFSVLPLAFLGSEGLVGSHLGSFYRLPVPGWSLPRDVQELLSDHVDAVEDLALFYARVLGVAAHGYHTFGAPHSRSVVRRMTDRARDRLGRLS